MDTDNSMNFLAIRDIKSQAFSSSLLEAFLESAPQFIMQFPTVIEIVSNEVLEDEKNINNDFQYIAGM
jgi:hypothetical protein